MRSTRLLVFPLLTLGLAVACGGDDSAVFGDGAGGAAGGGNGGSTGGIGNSGPGGAGTGAGSSVGGASGGTGAGGPGGGGPGGGAGTGGGGSSSGGSSAGGSGSGGTGPCQPTTSQAMRTTRNFHIIVDTSGSVEDSSSFPIYSAITSGLNTAFQSLSNAQVGLRFYPIMLGPTRCADTSACGAAGQCTKKICDDGGFRTCVNNNDCGGGISCVEIGGCTNTNRYCPQVGSSFQNCGFCAELQQGFCMEPHNCTQADYVTPSVALTPLPSGATTLSNALAAQSPVGGSPGGIALRGGLTYLQTYLSQNPEQLGAVVYMADDAPNQCGDGGQALADAAGLALGGSPSVPTHFVQLNTDGSPDNALVTAMAAGATAGGTTAPHIVNFGSGQTPAADASQAMATIADLGRCDYQLPAGAAASDISVKLSGMTLAAVADESGCAGSPDAWYFRNANGTPVALVLCQDACTKAEQTPTEAEVVVACQ